jgi:hypothetical protein
MAHRYNPLQARDRHGRWVAKAGNKAFGAGVKAAGLKVSKSSGTDNTGVTIKGVKLPIHFVPYVRVNKRSQTVGYNVGTKIIPGTGGRRLSIGRYVRLEDTKKKTAVDRFVDKGVAKVFPGTTRRGKVATYARKNFQITNPTVRGSIRNAQVRLGTSRGAGPTIIVRRGKHKVAQPKSQRGVAKYDASMSKIAGKRSATGVKKSRPQRRRAARRKKK